MLAAPDPSPEKRCPRCGETKPSSAFYRARKSKDGLAGYCKACAKTAAVLWQKANPEKKRTTDRVQAARPDKKKRMRERLDAWEAAHPIERKVLSRERGRRYRKKHPEKIRAIHRHRKYALPPETWEGLVEVFGGRCAYCGTSGPLVPDHVVPLSRGGPRSPENVVPACLACNASKGARTLVEWVKALCSETPTG